MRRASHTRTVCAIDRSTALIRTSPSGRSPEDCRVCRRWTGRGLRGSLAAARVGLVSDGPGRGEAQHHTITEMGPGERRNECASESRCNRLPKRIA